jgi:hypothetical protein
MSADSIIYCLEHLTDYRQFERLCSDVMNQSGYRDIEPLGGTNDRGRDALHVSRIDPNDITIFAYSVRPDWQQKLLNEDCKRIQEEKHVLRRLVFAYRSRAKPRIIPFENSSTNGLSGIFRSFRRNRPTTWIFSGAAPPHAGRKDS